jgi:hypothetical protein
LTLKEFLGCLRGGEENYFVICSDDLGISGLVRNAVPEDQRHDLTIVDASTITMEKARHIESLARKAGLATQKNWFYISSFHRIPAHSVGALLKVVEQSSFSRFIFQAQWVPPWVETVRSRCLEVRLPFLTRAAVYGNMKLLNYDAKEADRHKLWDGTLGGTIKRLGMKDAMSDIRRQVKGGTRSTAALLLDETIRSNAFMPTICPFLDDDEEAYLRRSDTPSRRRLMAFVLSRKLGA